MLMAQVAQEARDLREPISVRALLEWAFGTELATLDFDEYGGPAGIDTIWMLMQRGRLGCKVDGGRYGGGAQSASDAEIVAGIVASLPVEHGGRSMAVRVAELARAGMAPDWLKGARTRVVPVEWRRSKHGMFAQTKVVGHVQVRGRKGALVQREMRCCPVRYEPTAQQIAAARRFYLDWVGALMHLRHQLRLAGLTRWDVTDDLPPMTPWVQSEKTT